MIALQTHEPPLGAAHKHLHQCPDALTVTHNGMLSSFRQTVPAHIGSEPQSACRDASWLSTAEPLGLDLGLEVNDLLPGEVRDGLAAKVAVGGRLLVPGAVQVQVAGDQSCTQCMAFEASGIIILMLQPTALCMIHLSAQHLPRQQRPNTQSAHTRRQSRKVMQEQVQNAKVALGSLRVQSWVAGLRSPGRKSKFLRTAWRISLSGMVPVP